MFSELPKVFDRNFVTGFFLPVTIFTTLSFWIIKSFGVATVAIAFIQKDIILSIALLSLVSWIGGIFLLATNRDLYRFLEGYGEFSPLRLIAWAQKMQYSKLQKTLAKLDDEYLNYQRREKEIPHALHKKRNKVLKDLSEHFPDEERWLLPTSFGNTLRAFEVYPRIMYGIESICWWNRLLAVMPSDYRNLIDNAKAQVDFWVNLGLLSLLLIIEYSYLGSYAS